jgi:Fur family ferric uptake transcriptional regulator
MTGLLADRLCAAGYRLTAARSATIRVLESGDPHLSPAEVLERGRAFHPALSRATVYRTLELLTSLGLLRPLYGGEDGVRFACVADGHHHLICLKCGAAIHFDRCGLDDGMEHDLEQQFGFEVKSHMLELYGLCADCRRALPEEK